MPDFNIDYDAEVPLTQKVPISIKALSNKPPGERIADFIPSLHKAREMAKCLPSKEEQRVHTKKVIVDRTTDWRSYEDEVKLQASRNSRVIALAKEVYRNNESKRLEYEKAKTLVKVATEEQKLNPDKALDRAMRIVDRGHPMTKKMAMKIATDKVLAERA